MNIPKVIEKLPTDSPKEFIERIRRDKFGIGGRDTNTLASDLHGTIQQLSVELYQNDFHFIKEIIQNAEDNVYEEHVCPSLEFQLIQDDIAEVGASATLLIFNNERGLRTEDVRSLCSAGKSTKIGKRNNKFIGCKGIGFKSVFMISHVAIIISNGYRISFQDTPRNEAGMGYIVPEWIETPSDDVIRFASGLDNLPTTIIILPIRENKVNLVRSQLKELSPEMILFLTQIRELSVVDKTKDAIDSIELLRIRRSEPISGIVSNVYKFSEVTLSVESCTGMVIDTRSYLIFQGAFPVTHPVEERKEIKEWTLTLAFPKEGRASSGHVGDVFSFLPTELRTGFPFIINADFLLTTSRETIRFDSSWNAGILDCIPAAYELSFQIMLRRKRLIPGDITLTSRELLNVKDAYKFLPYSSVDQNAYSFSRAGAQENRQVRRKLFFEPQQGAKLEKVRTEIFERLREHPLIRLSSLSDHNRLPNSRAYKSARYCLQIKPNFRNLLVRAAQSNHPSPSAVNILPDGSTNPRNQYAIVDGYLQDKYGFGLVALGVPEMTTAQYLRFLRDSEWLMGLPEKLYFCVLTFFAFELNILNGTEASEGRSCQYLKIRGVKGKVELASFSDIDGAELVYTSSAAEESFISAWAEEFRPWYSVRVMPTKTAQALKEANNSKDLTMWIQKHASFTALSVQKYAESLIEKLMIHKSKNDVKFSLLVVQFLYSGICATLLSREVIVQSLTNRSYVSIVDTCGTRHDRIVSLKMRLEGGILLPRSVSKWPLLFSFPRSNAKQVVMELSDQYLEPQCSLVDGSMTRSIGPDSLLEFIRVAFSAVDLPYVKFQANEGFHFNYPVTMQKSVLLFQWLKVFLPRRQKTKTELKNDSLLTGLKELSWVKTCQHGWQCPSSVFFPLSHFENHFTAHDLPLLDASAYPSDLNLARMQVTFEELGVVTDMRKGHAAVARYFSSRVARELDREVVHRFYAYLAEVRWKNGVTERVQVWVPASGTGFLSMWRDPAECVLRDGDNIFEEGRDVTILDKIYDDSLLPFFSDVLRVPENASADLYCKIWLKWSRAGSALEAELEIPRSFSVVKVQTVWKNILRKNWQNSSEEDWASFCSLARVPVAPPSDDELISENISVMLPNQTFLADDLALSKSFSVVADYGKLNFAWLLPGLSAKQVECLVKLYSKMGVKKLSESVTCDVHFPPNVRKKKIPPGKGLICEGLFRSVLAYLCKNGEKHGLALEGRQQIVAQLISATEFVVTEPFEISSSLHAETLTAPATVTKKVFSHYDKDKRELFYLKKDHALLGGHVAVRVFNAKLVAMVSLGILSEHPKLVQGLIFLLKLLCDSGFAMKAVEYELQAQNLSIFPEDEKLLVENMAIREQTH